MARQTASGCLSKIVRLHFVLFQGTVASQWLDERDSGREQNLHSSANSALQYGVELPNCDPCGAGGIQWIYPAGYHIPTDLEWSRWEYCMENNITDFLTTNNLYRRHSGLRKELNVKALVNAIEKWFELEPEIFKENPLQFKNKVLLSHQLKQKLKQ